MDVALITAAEEKGDERVIAFEPSPARRGERKMRINFSHNGRGEKKKGKGEEGNLSYSFNYGGGGEGTAQLLPT